MSLIRFNVSLLVSLYDVYLIVAHLRVVAFVSYIALWGDEFFLFEFASVFVDGFWELVLGNNRHWGLWICNRLTSRLTPSEISTTQIE